jgi:hypothetical protein
MKYANATNLNRKSGGMGHPEIHGTSCLAKHESRTCFFSESRTRGTGRVAHSSLVLA